MRCWSSADAFATPVTGPEWSDALGWDAAPYYETIRAVTPRRHCVVDERCGDDVDDDCDGEIDEGCEQDTTGAGDDASEAGDGDGDGDGTAASDSGSDDASLPVTFGESEDAGGCACSTSPRGSQAVPWLVLVLAIARRRAATTASRPRRG